MEDDSHDDDYEDDRSTSFLSPGKAAPPPVRRRLPPANALPRSSSFRKSKSKIRRGVSFNSGGPELHRVESVRSLLNFDDKEVSQLWYDQVELETTKTESYALVEQAESKEKGAPPLCQETETLRGLESKTEEGSMTSFMNRVNAIGAVLDHQEEAQKRQQMNGGSECSSASSMADDEELASLASLATEDAKKLAIERALQDEKEAWEYLNSDASAGENNLDASRKEAEKEDMVIQMEVEKEKPVKAVTKRVGRTLTGSKAAPAPAATPVLSDNRPTPKREGSLRIPAAFASTGDNAVPDWVKPNATAGAKKKPIGRSKSFTPKTATATLLLGRHDTDDEMSDSEDEEDLLAPPKQASASVPPKLAPGRIARPAKKGADPSAPSTSTSAIPAPKKTKTPIARSKSLDLETAAVTMGLVNTKRGATGKKSSRLAELKAKAAQGTSLDTPPDTS